MQCVVSSKPGSVGNEELSFCHCFCCFVFVIRSLVCPSCTFRNASSQSSECQKHLEVRA